MNWKKHYSENLVSPQEAVSFIPSGSRIVLAHAAGEPKVLVDALVENGENYKDVTISQMVSLSKAPYLDPKFKDSFFFSGWFLTGDTRGAVNDGRADLVPVFFHEVPKMIREEIFRTDVMLVTVSEPDDYGYVSLGVSCDFTVQGVESAKLVIAEVNKQMPFTYGDTVIHVSEIDKFVESDRPIYTSGIAPIGEVEEQIGKYCASLIEDGSTLQLGIGGIPNAVLAQLKDKKDLGIHSEMISDGVVDLYESGAITGKMKSMDKGKMTVAFLMGTKRLYDFVNKNPAIEMRTVDYVNHPTVVAECAKMVCINSCIQIDFMGQVVSSTLGEIQFSGVGGQVDFVRGAGMSKDGKAKAIIAMPSVTVKKDGSKISKIVANINAGSSVTTTRNDVDYVVTEYGIARLKGKSLRERARALISIAHPDFREELTQAFAKRFKEL